MCFCTLGLVVVCASGSSVGIYICYFITEKKEKVRNLKGQGKHHPENQIH